jgi:Na+/melibiose symporter-like transporter
MLIFATPTLPLGSLGLAMSIYLQPYLARDLGVGLIAISTAFFIVRLIDIPVDPILALLMDRTKTPFGRYRPWQIIGAPILMLGVYQLFMAQKGVDTVYLIIWLLVMYLGLSTLNVARFAWSAKLITRYDHRSVFYGVLGMVGVIGAVSVLSMPVFIKGSLANSVHLMGWTIMALLPLGVALSSLFVPEQVSLDAHTSHAGLRDYLDLLKRPELVRLFLLSFFTTLGPGWMSNLYIFFFTQARGFTNGEASLLLIPYVLAGALGAPLIGLTAARFSKHRTLIASTIFYSLGLCTVLLAPKGNFLLTLPVMFWCGYWGNGFDLMTTAMMADVGDHVRLDQGKERMGLLFSLITLAVKLAGAGAVITAYPLLEAIGFDPKAGAHNTASAIDGLQVAFLVGPIFFVALGGLCCLGWKLDAKRHEAIRTELEARDEMLARAAS